MEEEVCGGEDGDPCDDGGGGGDFGGCDASQENCDNPCVGADGFTPSPGPYCQEGGTLPPVPVEAPTPTSPPTCTLEVESRPLDRFGIRHGPDLHGYLTFTTSAAPNVDTIIEGLHNGKLLGAGIGSPGAPEGQAGNSDNPQSNTDDGSITGAAVCAAFSILESDASKIKNADIAYHGILGPNSSSALRYFLTSLSSLLASFGNWYTIPKSMQLFGYNASLPGLN
jgi:hypothetical protein